MGYYIDDQGAKAILKFKYRGEDRSLIYRYVLTPMNRRLLQLIPMWIAPNLLTLSGFMLVCLAYSLVLSFNPTLDGVMPFWVTVYCGLSIFMYQTIDNLDGGQARRTGSSSALGFLFDHGVDVVNTAVASVVLFAVFQLGLTTQTFVLYSMGLVTFCFGTWAHYHTGTLVLGLLNGPTDGVLASVMFSIFTAFNPGIWTEPLADYLPMLESMLAGTQFANQPLNFVTVLSASIVSVVSIISFSYDVAVEKPLLPALVQLVPHAVFVSLEVLWFYYSPTQIFFSHPHIFLAAMCFMYSNLVCKMMLAHICHKTFHPWRGSLVPLAAVVANCLLPVFVPGAESPVSELTALYVWFLVSFGIFAHFVYAGIHEITDVLNIRAFVLPPPTAARSTGKQS